MRGFTAVRDVGGPSSPQRDNDDRVVVGPRIYPSGAFISQLPGTATSDCPTRCRGPQVIP